VTTTVPEDFRRVRSPFEGALTRLRAVEEQDLPRLNELIWDPDVTVSLGLAFPEAVAETREWWERNRSRRDGQPFAIETLAGELIGGCGLHEIQAHARSAILGIWIARAHWDQGYGTDAVRTLCRFGFREMNLRRITLHVHSTNPRGARAYGKVGFKEEGRLRGDEFAAGEPTDVVVMGLLAEDLAEA
jgi:RimJ/RimL family protein N-acetyltransferase